MHPLIESIKPVLLMGPGPSTVSSEVYDAIGWTTLSHLDPDFIGIMDALKGNLKRIMSTANEATFAVSGTGTAGMECCLVNTIEPGDSMLIPVNGYFGSRMADMAGRLGAKVDVLEFPWGSPMDLGVIREALGKKTYRLVGMVHAETSTGVANPVDSVGAFLKGTDSLFVVDAVTSLGGMEILPDAWGVDAMYSCSQKCLACPSGLSPVTFSPRAAAKAAARAGKIPNFYLDLNLLLKYWAGETRAYHHTAPANMYFALLAATQLLLDEGPANVYKRHRDAHEYLVSRAEDADLSMLVGAPHRLPMLNTIRIPEGLADAAVRKRLRVEHRIEIGAGLGSLAGKIWRVGLMGHTARRDNVDRLFEGLASLTGTGIRATV